MNWISAKDRLPKPGDRVIALIGRNIIIAHTFIEDNSEYWSAEDHDYLNVTHWMPLPEPPKEEA